MRKAWKDERVVEQRVSLMRGQVADLVVVRAKVVEGGWRERVEWALAELWGRNVAGFCEEE